MRATPKSLVAGALATVFALAGAGSATPRPGSVQAVPRETGQPRISGDLVEGSLITTNNGSWANTPTSYQYRWQRCTRNEDRTCADVPGANAQAYRITPADVARRLRVFVTACNGDGCSRPANSRITSVVSARAAPRNTRAPTVTGSAVVGQRLTGEPGDWANGVGNFDFQWQRCDANGDACTPIPRATGRVYTIDSDDLNRRLRMLVAARNNRGTTTAISAPSETVTPAGPAGQIKLSTGETSVPVTSVALPDRLVITGIRFEPRVVRTRAQPLIGRFRVTDTRGFVVRDALVYAIGVPPNRVSAAGETTTDQAGWATVTFRILRGQPMRRGATIVFFVRARKPGENVLAGVSTRRLVSVRVSPG